MRSQNVMYLTIWAMESGMSLGVVGGLYVEVETHHLTSAHNPFPLPSFIYRAPSQILCACFCPVVSAFAIPLSLGSFLRYLAYSFTLFSFCSNTTTQCLTISSFVYSLQLSDFFHPLLSFLFKHLFTTRSLRLL